MIRSTALRLCAFALTTSLAAAGAAQAQEAAPEAPHEAAEPAEVMVLGVFHFTGGGQDMINPEVDDFLSDRRQAEIAAVLDRLEAFAPTRIAIELTPEHEAGFNDRYRAYRDGAHELGVNERQQLGMALAARLGHDRLYAVDYARGMDFNAMMGAAQEAGQMALIGEFQSYVGDIQAWIEENSRLEFTVLERIQRMNSPEIVEGHDLYLILAQMGSLDNPAGAVEMEGWWGRNMRIFANIAYIAEPGERVLVIYGSGHKALLEEFVDGAPNLTLVDPMDYLD